MIIINKSDVLKNKKNESFSLMKFKQKKGTKIEMKKNETQNNGKKC